jgi:hypothetical protein
MDSLLSAEGKPSEGDEKVRLAYRYGFRACPERSRTGAASGWL